jgi:hypothetical protein
MNWPDLGSNSGLGNVEPYISAWAVTRLLLFLVLWSCEKPSPLLRRVIFLVCYLRFTSTSSHSALVNHSVRWRMPSSGMCKPFGRRLLVTANVVPNSPILVTLMTDALGSHETPFLTRATRRNIPEDAILHSQWRENPKSYIALTGWAL